MRDHVHVHTGVMWLQSDTYMTSHARTPARPPIHTTRQDGQRYGPVQSVSTRCLNMIGNHPSAECALPSPCAVRAVRAHCAPCAPGPLVSQRCCLPSSECDNTSRLSSGSGPLLLSPRGSHRSITAQSFIHFPAAARDQSSP